MKKYYKYIGVILILRYLYKIFLHVELKTGTYIGYEYYWAKKKYEEFIP